jgi:hypothetical protein
MLLWTSGCHQKAPVSGGMAAPHWSRFQHSACNYVSVYVIITYFCKVSFALRNFNIIHDYIFITNIIAITKIIIGVKRVNTFFPVFPLITAKKLIEFLKGSNNAVRKKKNRF